MKKILVLFALAALSVAAYAQEDDLQLKKQQKYPNSWFFGVGAGFNHSFDVGRYTSDWSARGWGTSLDIYAGKWLNRVFGVRIGYHGINTAAETEESSIDYGSHPFYYLYADAIFRPTTWLVPYLHAGYASVQHKAKSSSKGSFAGGAGLMFPIHAGKHLSFVPGIRATFFSGDIMEHSEEHTKIVRAKLSVTLGVAYRFGGNPKPKVVTEYVDREVYVPVEVERVDTVVLKQVDTVYIREYIKEKEDNFNRILSGLVLFDTNSSSLRSEAFPVLNDAALFLKENPHVKVIVEGHADITGNDRINQPLSERRAKAVADYLIHRGIEPERVQPIGYGSYRPKATNETSEGRQLNRRMDFVFVYE